MKLNDITSLNESREVKLVGSALSIVKQLDKDLTKLFKLYDNTLSIRSLPTIGQKNSYSISIDFIAPKYKDGKLLDKLSSMYVGFKIGDFGLDGEPLDSDNFWITASIDNDNKKLVKNIFKDVKNPKPSKVASMIIKWFADNEAELTSSKKNS